VENLSKKIRAIAQRAANECPYYRTLYSQAGIDINSFSDLEDFAQLPIVTPIDLSTNANLFKSQTADIYRVTSSSGTIQSPKTLFRTVQDTKTSVEVMCRLFSLAGLEAGDSLWIGQPFDLAHLGYISLEACQKLSVLAIPGGLSVTDQRMINLLAFFQPNAIFTSPSRMCQITQYYLQSGEKPPKIAKILLAGEPCSAIQRFQICDFWQIEPHNLYGSEETDGLAGSCSQHSGLHFMDDLYYLELVEPGTNKKVPDGQAGEAVITSLYFQGTPLIRYRLGDIIEPIPGQCRCGKIWTRIKVIGRSTQALFLYDGIKLYSHQIRSALTSIDPQLTTYQAVLRRGIDGADEIEIVTVAAANVSPAMHNKIEEALWSSSLDLAAAKDIGKLRLQFNPNGEMFMTLRGKTPEIVDLRENKEHEFVKGERG
jgi:phenylacetate-CoA ligase